MFTVGSMFSKAENKRSRMGREETALSKKESAVCCVMVCF